MRRIPRRFARRPYARAYLPTAFPSIHISGSGPGRPVLRLGIPLCVGRNENDTSRQAPTGWVNVRRSSLGIVRRRPEERPGTNSLKPCGS